MCNAAADIVRVLLLTCAAAAAGQGGVPYSGGAQAEAWCAQEQRHCIHHCRSVADVDSTGNSSCRVSFGWVSGQLQEHLCDSSSMTGHSSSSSSSSSSNITGAAAALLVVWGFQHDFAKT
jgi:hypothetical protein